MAWLSDRLRHQLSYAALLASTGRAQASTALSLARCTAKEDITKRDVGSDQTAISSAAAVPARFGFFALAGSNSEPAARPAVSATPGSRVTIAATMAPSINSAS